MKNKPHVTLAIVALCLIVAASPLRALWLNDGVPICTAPEDQTDHRIIPDGAGGAIMTWQDYRGGSSYDIYAQRIDAAGSVLWTINGLALCTAAGAQTLPQICSDGAFGAIIAWCDYRSGSNDIYAQRVNGSGAVQWTTNGVAVCAATGSQSSPHIVSDGAGGAIIAWHDNRGANTDIYAQRLDELGAAQWTANGVTICTATGNQMYPQLVEDGVGGAVVTWHDARGGNYDIYAQRVNGSGAVQWTANGVVLCANTSDQQYPRIATDGASGAIVTWDDARGGNSEIYAQRVNASGVVQWTANGIVIAATTGYQRDSQLTPDGAGGAIVTWNDNRSGDYHIYAQRVDGTGSTQWTVHGVIICAASNGQRLPQITPSAGGALIAWEDERSGTADIYAQRISGAGIVQWQANGVALCTPTGSQESPQIASDGEGGAIVLWSDYHIGGNGIDLYAQRILEDGQLVSSLLPIIAAVEDVPNDQGGKLVVRWLAAAYDERPAETITHYSVWRSIDFPEAAMLFEQGAVLVTGADVTFDFGDRAIRKAELGASEFWWEWVGNVDAHYLDRYSMTCATLFDSTGTDPAMHYFFVSAHTAEPFVFWDSAIDSGYSVDNLSPDPPSELVGEQSYSPIGLELTWTPNEEHDLAHYAVYRGLAADFAPGSENLVAQPIDTSYFDEGWTWESGFFYKVSALDIHGNESSYTLLTPDDISGNDGPLAASACYLAQNYPNPFNPTTRIPFKLPATVHVSLAVYDASGRLVRVLVDDERRAGHYSVLWDGRDSNGRLVASGIYFYRLTAGDYRESRKMALAR